MFGASQVISGAGRDELSSERLIRNLDVAIFMLDDSGSTRKFFFFFHEKFLVFCLTFIHD